MEPYSNLISQLAPVVGPLAAILLVLGVPAIIFLWRDNVRLRTERNNAVEKKDTDLKELNNKVIELQEKSINSNNSLRETIVQLGNEANLRSQSEALKTDSIVKTMEGIQSVLVNIHQK